LQPDYGESQGRAWLAFGITTVRSPGNTPYEAVEEREANEAGVRPGRACTAPATDGVAARLLQDGIAIFEVAHFEMELQRCEGACSTT